MHISALLPGQQTLGLVLCCFTNCNKQENAYFIAPILEKRDHFFEKTQGKEKGIITRVENVLAKKMKKKKSRQGCRELQTPAASTQFNPAVIVQRKYLKYEIFIKNILCNVDQQCTSGRTERWTD